MAGTLDAARPVVLVPIVLPGRNTQQRKPYLPAPVARSGADWPVLDRQPGDREVLNIGGREPGSRADRGGGDQAVSLMQGDTFRRESRRQPPASSASVRSIANTRSPANSRSAAACSLARSPRTISSTLIADVAGCVPARRNPSTRWAAGRPRNTSMRTVVSRSNRPTVSPWAAVRRAAPVPIRPGPHPTNGLCRRAPRRWQRGHPSVARLPERPALLRSRRHCAGADARADPTRPPRRRQELCADACADDSPLHRPRNETADGRHRGMGRLSERRTRGADAGDCAGRPAGRKARQRVRKR